MIAYAHNTAPMHFQHFHDVRLVRSPEAPLGTDFSGDNGELADCFRRVLFSRARESHRLDHSGMHHSYGIRYVCLAVPWRTDSLKLRAVVSFLLGSSRIGILGKAIIVRSRLRCVS